MVNDHAGGGKRTSAHRRAYRLHHGDPGELSVLHRCDNRLCGNPDHLFLGTHRDNWADAIAKGRPMVSVPGEGNRGAKLTTAEVMAIRKSAAKTADLVRQYGVSRSAIYRVIRGETWQNLQHDSSNGNAKTWQSRAAQPATTSSTARRRVTVCTA